MASFWPSVSTIDGIQSGMLLDLQGQVTFEKGLKEIEAEEPY
jgi:hypothetical protein